MALPGVLAGLCVWLLLWQLPARALTADTPVTGNATYFDALGSPYGGCGLPQATLDTQDFVALNVFNTPGDYGSYPRPLPASMAGKIGMWDNGRNCGRWVRVEIGDYCTGVNDGAPGQAFCRGGSWTADGYNGAALNMIVADSCGDANAWCRDDPYHLDLAKDSLNRFVKNGAAVGDLYPNHWNNRHITWSFVPAPNYAGDIQVGFLQGAQTWWGAIAISHLANGLHGVEYYAGGAWQKAQMNSDMGESYIISPTTSGGTQFRVRAYDASDTLINNGRIYTFGLPPACSSQCSAPYTKAAYTTENPGTTATPTVSVTPTTSPTTSPSQSPTTTPSGTVSCAVTYQIASSWQGGFTTNVTVKNTGASAWNNWTVGWTVPSGTSLVNAWNATITTSGTRWTIKAPSWAATLAAGASASFGFQASGTSTTAPTAIACT
jgi:hypothetical protein